MDLAPVVRKISESLPSMNLAKVDWKHVKDLKLEDPDFRTPGKIGLLLGVPIYGYLLLPGLIKVSSTIPVAQNTEFGWILSGATRSIPRKLNNFHLKLELEDQLKRFFEQEEVSKERILTNEEIACEGFFEKTVQRDEEGRSKRIRIQTDVEGRLQNSNLEYDRKHPLIVTAGTIAKLIITEVHERTLHGGTRLTMNMVRESYWIINLRRQTKQNILNCVKCCRFTQKLSEQIMADLPQARVSETTPFTHTGLDYAGPFNIKASNVRAPPTRIKPVVINGEVIKPPRLSFTFIHVHKSIVNALVASIYKLASLSLDLLVLEYGQNRKRSLMKIKSND
ncbi:hypothetical protein Bhyg_07678 [Pseudolycoriella hygida]|uniref:Integrase zinc-binding domain-containing protein n=1 Tax=Pseudolycoriella hygida TaxID=35572 RepID=A0A9Q0N354_9DIPT|nr:hypothetical protein Bhyg_07678 [Pseudolycoriella hygida]